MKIFSLYLHLHAKKKQTEGKHLRKRNDSQTNILSLNITKYNEK